MSKRKTWQIRAKLKNVFKGIDLSNIVKGKVSLTDILNITLNIRFGDLNLDGLRKLAEKKEFIGVESKNLSDLSFSDKLVILWKKYNLLVNDVEKTAFKNKTLTDHFTNLNAYIADISNIIPLVGDAIYKDHDFKDGMLYIDNTNIKSLVIEDCFNLDSIYLMTTNPKLRIRISNLKKRDDRGNITNENWLVIYFNNTEIRNLDIKGTKKLTFDNINNCKIAELTLWKIDEVENLSLEKVESASLSKVKIGDKLEVEDTYLTKKLTLDNLEIKQLSIKSDEKLVIDGIEELDKLETIKIEGNKIKLYKPKDIMTIDLSKLTNLQSLEINSNKLNGSKVIVNSDNLRTIKLNPDKKLRKLVIENCSNTISLDETHAKKIVVKKDGDLTLKNIRDAEVVFDRKRGDNLTFEGCSNTVVVPDKHVKKITNNNDMIGINALLSSELTLSGKFKIMKNKFSPLKLKIVDVDSELALERDVDEISIENGKELTIHYGTESKVKLKNITKIVEVSLIGEKGPEHLSFTVEEAQNNNKLEIEKAQVFMRQGIHFNSHEISIKKGSLMIANKPTLKVPVKTYLPLNHHTIIISNNLDAETKLKYTSTDDLLTFSFSAFDKDNTTITSYAENIKLEKPPKFVFPKAKKLELNGNDEKYDVDFNNLKSISTLNMYSFKTKKIDILNLANLREVSISGLQETESITIIGENPINIQLDLNSLKSTLKSLTLDKVKIGTFDPRGNFTPSSLTIKDFTQLQSLSIKGTNPSHPINLQLDLSKSKGSLQSLILKNIKLIGPAYPNLASIIINNSFTHLQTVLFSEVHIKELKIENTQITNLVLNSISNLENLTIKGTDPAHPINLQLKLDHIKSPNLQSLTLEKVKIEPSLNLISFNNLSTLSFSNVSIKELNIFSTTATNTTLNSISNLENLTIKGTDPINLQLDLSQSKGSLQSLILENVNLVENLNPHPNFKSLTFDNNFAQLQTINFSNVSVKSIMIENTHIINLTLDSIPKLETLSIKGTDANPINLQLNLSRSKDSLQSLTLEKVKLNKLELDSFSNLNKVSIDSISNLENLTIKGTNPINLQLDLNSLKSTLKSLTLDKVNIGTFDARGNFNKLTEFKIEDFKQLSNLSLNLKNEFENISIVGTKKTPINLQLNLSPSQAILRSLTLNNVTILNDIGGQLDKLSIEGFNNLLVVSLNLKNNLQALSIKGTDANPIQLQLNLKGSKKTIETITLDKVELSQELDITKMKKLSFFLLNSEYDNTKDIFVDRIPSEFYVITKGKIKGLLKAIENSRYIKKIYVKSEKGYRGDLKINSNVLSLAYFNIDFLSPPNVYISSSVLERIEIGNGGFLWEQQGNLKLINDNLGDIGDEEKVFYVYKRNDVKTHNLLRGILTRSSLSKMAGILKGIFKKKCDEITFDVENKKFKFSDEDRDVIDKGFFLNTSAIKDLKISVGDPKLYLFCNFDKVSFTDKVKSLELKVSISQSQKNYKVLKKLRKGINDLLS